MLQDMDHMEASCIFHVKVGMFDQLEQSKIWVLTVTTLGIEMLIVQHDMILSICFLYHPGDFLSQTSLDVLSVKEIPVGILQTGDFGCRSPLLIPVNKLPTLNPPPANCGTVGNSCNLQLYTV